GADLVLLVASSDGRARRDWLAEVPSHVRTILISPHHEGAMIREAFERGAAGFLSPKVCAAELIRAIWDVASGGRYLESELVSSLLVDESSDPNGASAPRLTPRQSEVLGLVASGLENKQIARRLGIAEGTVKSHLRVVYSRLGATGRAEAVAAAFRLGLLD
ncbi:MAG: response regulator transcription factor, partial [Halobacteriales archaeon]|nr:response regulator transcription factor [Halobacteriales archaeon]